MKTANMSIARNGKLDDEQCTNIKIAKLYSGGIATQ